MFTTYDLRQLLDGIATLFQWGYWGTMLLMLAILVPIAFHKGESHNRKIFNAIGVSAGIIVLFVQIIPMLLMMALGPSKAERQEAEEWQRKYQAAEALFKQQCEKAGEKIYRTVDNVEGIMLLKVVPKSNYSSADARARDPMWADAALQTGEGEEFIGEFLGFYIHRSIGYEYVDVLQENQKNTVRYAGKNTPLIQKPNPKNPARYAVTFEQNLDPELRKHWVAGATIQIIDRQTNEVIAEKVTYAFEKGLGGLGGHRMPWHFAVLCNNEYINSLQLYEFVVKVLIPFKPKQEMTNVKH